MIGQTMSPVKLLSLSFVLVCFVIASPDGEAQTRLPKGSVLRIGPGTEKTPAGGYIVAFSEDGKKILTGSEQLVVCDVKTGKVVRKIPARFDATNLGGTSTYGRRIGCYSTEGTLEIWDTQTAKRIATFPRKSEHNVCHLAPTGGKIGFVKNFQIHIMDSKTKKRLQKWRLPNERTLFAWSQQYGQAQLAFSPNGQTLATIQYAVIGKRAGLGLKIRSWDTESRTSWSTIVFPAVKQVLQPWPMFISPDNRLLGIATPQTKLAIYEIASGQAIVEFDTRKANALQWPEGAFSRDGRLFAYFGKDDKIRVVDLFTGDEHAVFAGHEGWVTSLAFSPDGTRLASADTFDTTFVWKLPKVKAGSKEVSAKELNRLWSVLASRNAKSGYKAIGTLRDHKKEVIRLFQDRLGKTDSSPKMIAKWIEDLNSESFRTRIRAEKKLIYLGSTVESELRSHLAKNVPLEMRLRIERILPKLKGLPPEVLQQLRATAVLEFIGTKQAKSILEGMAKNPLSVLSQRMAKCALTRLESKDDRSGHTKQK